MDPAELQTLIRAIEAKDLATAAHTWRVVLYARAMAEEGGLGRDRIERISIAAALHDVGKLDIPSAILQKPGKLTDEEFAVIQQHPVTGYARMIKMDVEDEDILDLIRFHHERVDGKGYPYGLAGDAIPVVARYFAVIDTFDALTSIRPYRTEIGEDAAERALVILSEGAGSAFAPEAVELFTALYREQKIDHVLHYFNDEFPSPDFQLEQVRQHERTDRRNA